ncbi:nudix hydrolase 14, chloroplastic isoform X2 [Nymphaea colorata]|uniref:nudix hydrolase 14, chloroplastic isoform X2 n=1 Tax=Nymphaea colorata TaxID=210225 RepID=UPI00129DD0A9|nr:nudix hydrolase 14, chloroplastic isoform X2 [Nymphaea colorata]
MKLVKAMICARALFSFAGVPARRRSSWLGGLRRACNSFPVLPTTRRLSSYFPLSTASRDLTMCEAQEVESGRPLSLTLDVLGAPVRVVASPALSDSEFRKAVDCLVFKNWLRNLHGEKGILATEAFSLREVLIQGVDMFGRSVGFLKFKAEIIDKKTGKMARVPVGRFILELPAGMLDDDKGDVIGAAVREVEEETGIHLNLDELVNLTALLDPSTGCRMFPSPGGCDEELILFLYRGHVKKEVIEALQGQETGLRERGELIKVRVVPYKKLWRLTADAKVLASIALYEMAKREGLLPPPKNAPDLSAI